MAKKDLQQYDLRSPEAARQCIEDWFAESPKRKVHVLTVAEHVRRSAEQLAAQGQDIDPNAAYCAALMHDIGYLEPINKTGFHPWDGYHFLKEHGYKDFAEWIVCHSASTEHAEVVGQPAVPISDHIIAKLISYWDVQVKQGGEVVSYDERLADIYKRHGKESGAGKAHQKAEARIQALIAEVDAMLK